MNRETISQALGGVAARHLIAVESYERQWSGPERKRIMSTHTHRSYRSFYSLLLAACLLLALGVAAYAADLFGVRALLIRHGRLAPEEGVSGGYISITQPQEVPDDMDPTIRQKIENSEKAWSEWEAWRKEHGIREPEVFHHPNGTETFTVDENEDGTWKLTFYSSYEPVFDDKGEVIDFTGEVIETRTATAEEYNAWMDYSNALSMGYPGYDFKYNVYSREMADKLEEIAVRYSLKLRHKNTVLFQNFGEQKDFLTREELTAKVNEIAAGGGRFFRTEPTGYDKFYYYDEGTFAVSFYTTDDFTNDGTSAYLYNSPYGTLSSGYEIIGQVENVEKLEERVHVTPDGTELTVLHNGAEMYAYTYLENSFVTIHIRQGKGLNDAQIDAVLDMVDYSTIQ